MKRKGTAYRINVQGMIVEELEEMDTDESDEMEDCHLEIETFSFEKRDVAS